MIAKDRGALDVMLGAISTGVVEKGYRCIVAGKPEPPGATIRAFLSKNQAKGRVAVYQTREAAPAGSLKILTRYRTISYDLESGTSYLEVSLLTGRTHQIRAHLASIGHPVIGDGKYCPNSINKQYGASYQMLIAYKLVFPEIPGFEISGKTIEIPDSLTHPTKY